MMIGTYRFEVVEIDTFWTINAVFVDGEVTSRLIGLYESREAAEANLPRVAQEWMDEEKRKAAMRATTD